MFRDESGRTHPAVQVDRRLTGHQAMVAGIDEVRAALEGCNPAPTPGQCRHDRQGHGCLAAAALGGGYQESMFIHMLRMCKKLQMQGLRVVRNKDPHPAVGHPLPTGEGNRIPSPLGRRIG